MSDIPPSGPPPQFAAYPRGGAPYGSADRLQSLADGYFGLNNVFLIHILIYLCLVFGPPALPDNVRGKVLLVGFFVLALAVGFLTYPQNKKIGEGAGWSPSSAAIASVLMAVNAVICCGIVGYVVVQQLAFKEMKKYGVTAGFIGARKKDVQALIDQMRAQAGP